MKTLTLVDFDNLEFKEYSPDNKCAFCNETANNGGNNMCDSHTDTYRKLRQQAETERFNVRIKELNIDLSQIDDIEIDGVDHSDAHDYVDAFISSASQNGIDLTDDQLDFINDSCRDFVYEKLMDQLY
jgi:histone acetyltransferase (RNA polymerase elongator complex component)